MFPTPGDTRTRRAHESAWRVDVRESIWTAPIECQSSVARFTPRGAPVASWTVEPGEALEQQVRQTHDQPHDSEPQSKEGQRPPVLAMLHVSSMVRSSGSVNPRTI